MSQIRLWAGGACSGSHGTGGRWAPRPAPYASHVSPGWDAGLWWELGRASLSSWVRSFAHSGKTGGFCCLLPSTHSNQGPPSACPPGFHGSGCQGVCECQQGASCDPVSGQCLCPAGFHGQFCEKGCQPGFFGDGCQQRCDCHKGVPCDPVSGLCLCPPGRTGATCDLDCRRGRFGPGCALHCDCWGGADCDPISGQCHCVDGYTGPTCREGESGSQGRNRRLPSPWPGAHPLS